ncbi:MAG: ThuA domain-containing protein [Phycisphaeraceae bacterium]|nr:ThuA domain-containing protein [Phycisphaeraceae bacterium]
MSLRSSLTAALTMLGLLGTSMSSGSEPNLRRHEFTKLSMGSQARIVLFASTESEARRAAAGAFERIEALESIMSDYRPTSELSRLNALDVPPSGQTLPLSEDLTRVLERSEKIRERTGGAFDVRAGRVVRLWRDARQRGPTLSDLTELRRSAQALGDFDLDPEARTITLRSRVTLDLGGIGKGFAADAASQTLTQLGAPAHLIDLGGDIALGDAPPDATGWGIAIAGTGPEQARVALHNCGIATSGPTDRFFAIGSTTYSHIIDPRTGVPVSEPRIVTVIAPDATDADALATAMSVLTPGESLRVAASTPGVHARIEVPDNLVITSNGFPWASRTPPRAEPDAEFIPLFNGRDLVGWKGLVADPPARARMSPVELAQAQFEADRKMRAHWSVEDGMLVFDGEGDSICTARDYADFELIVEWKIGPQGDSGIYLRGSPQVQIWDNPIGSGGLYNNQKNASQPLVVADRPVGEWNTFHIIMQGERVTVYLNGRLVVGDTILENYWERDKPIYPSGQIELQNHGNTLYFRNISLRPLGPGDRPSVATTTPFPRLAGARVLVFTRTAGFRHDSIEAGVQAMRDMAAQHGFSIVHTEDPTVFDNNGLAPYDAVVFLNTTGDILNPTQEAAFEAFVRSGGGFVGIHSAADTEYDWPFYGLAVGAYFKGHPPVQAAMTTIASHDHPATRRLPDSWKRTDEWYDYRAVPEGATVLARIDEASYEGGQMGADHPIAWCREIDQGRTFYTGFGHTQQSYSEPEVRAMLAGALAWVTHRD